MPKQTSLSSKEKAICKVCLIHIVVAKLLAELDAQLKSEENNPAIQQCTKLIDELLEPLEDERRDAIIARINKSRERITKKGSTCDVGSGLIASLDVLTSGKIKSRPGTRLDFIITTFSINLKQVKRTVPYREHSFEKFKNLLIGELNAI